MNHSRDGHAHELHALRLEQSPGHRPAPSEIAERQPEPIPVGEGAGVHPDAEACADQGREVDGQGADDVSGQDSLHQHPQLGGLHVWQLRDGEPQRRALSRVGDPGEAHELATLEHDPAPRVEQQERDREVHQRLESD